MRVVGGLYPTGVSQRQRWCGSFETSYVDRVSNAMVEGTPRMHLPISRRTRCLPFEGPW
jgi:hypothetical protein